MAENETKVNEVVEKITKAAYETNQAIARSAVAAQERNIQFAQGVFGNTIEVLKSHVEATRTLVQQLEDQAREPQKAFQTVVESTVAAQKRNVELAQNIAESGVETLKSHVDASRGLSQMLVGQAQEQQNIFLALPYVKAYQEWFYAPLTYYKQVVETTQSATEQALEVARSAAQQGLEINRKATQQFVEQTLEALQQR